MGRTELAKKRYPSQTLLRRHAAIFRENSSQKEDIKFSIGQVNADLVENDPRIGETHVWWFPTNTAGLVSKYSLPSKISNHTPVNHHIVCLKLLATVHCDKPAFPIMRRNIDAKTPYEAQMTSAPILASVRPVKEASREAFGEGT